MINTIIFGVVSVCLIVFLILIFIIIQKEKKTEKKIQEKIKEVDRINKESYEKKISIHNGDDVSNFNNSINVLSKPKKR